MTTFSADLAKFLVGLCTESMPSEVVQKARVCLYNAFGMGINGHATPYAPVARTAAGPLMCGTWAMIAASGSPVPASVMT